MGLLEGKPYRRAIIFLDSCAPQHDDIDAAIRYAVAAQGLCDPAGRMVCIPGLEPGTNPFLQLRHNYICDLLVNIGSHCLFLLLKAGCVCNPASRSGNERWECGQGPACREGDHPFCRSRKSNNKDSPEKRGDLAGRALRLVLDGM